MGFLLLHLCLNLGLTPQTVIFTILTTVPLCPWDRDSRGEGSESELLHSHSLCPHLGICLGSTCL